MISDSRAATSWDSVLEHRSADTRQSIRERFEQAGVTADQVRAALADNGDELYSAAVSGVPGWAEPYGGMLAVALLAAEIGALTAHLTSRSARVRGLAVDALLEDYSAVAVAGRLGVARQKVYEIARAHSTGEFIARTPGRLP
ncbi:hypothetical protein [Actinoplanes sp. N902-109]|uniref:hypothetical protein n=1 Tax=Actinoplanes sp. (strain N902-109) TaxID=649831 RepID=UPI000329618B|nr:hypothetical protein [Actinoplanes sp. N902-109]AGL17714.1 hypothetical protein L083_4204 [Actinoplanes sp. N902-109]